MLPELELVAEAPVNEFITNLRPELLAGCPAADRAGLTSDLDRLDMEIGVGTAGEVEE